MDSVGATFPPEAGKPVATWRLTFALESETERTSQWGESGEGLQFTIVNVRRVLVRADRGSRPPFRRRRGGC
jgi:hypothetical protein